MQAAHASLMQVLHSMCGLLQTRICVQHEDQSRIKAEDQYILPVLTYGAQTWILPRTFSTNFEQWKEKWAYKSTALSYQTGIKEPSPVDTIS
ncbi:unnamed protein product [Arctia plantaginis]|uniref:Uncharacterized protein n=1 Tax=Arctia plantaginis TaxID=874455 RepID=A0A8S1BAP5_ARCPL|nr:unnamed protein product [Arctia plantaginis]